MVFLGSHFPRPLPAWGGPSRAFCSVPCNDRNPGPVALLWFAVTGSPRIWERTRVLQKTGTALNILLFCLVFECLFDLQAELLIIIDNILAIEHFHLVQLIVHNLKPLLHSDWICNAALREWYAFAFGITLDLGYVSRIEIDTAFVSYFDISVHNCKCRGTVFNGIFKQHWDSQSPEACASKFCTLEKLVNQLKNHLECLYFWGINLEKTVWCSCSYRYSCHEQAGWVVSKQRATWW